jgi:hypothetical protein
VTSLAASTKSIAFPRALVRVCTRAQRELWGLKLTRLYGFGIGLSYAALTLLGSPSVGAIGKLWVGCMTTASWVAGVGALSLATDLAARDEAQGLSQLAALRGYGRDQLERARLLAGAIRLSATITIPAAITLVVALSRFRTLGGASTAVALAIYTLPYAALLGGTLSLAARAASRWLPGRGRWLFLALMLGPWLLAKGTGTAVPNVPHAFGWLLAHAAGSLR